MAAEPNQVAVAMDQMELDAAPPVAPLDVVEQEDSSQFKDVVMTAATDPDITAPTAATDVAITEQTSEADVAQETVAQTKPQCGVCNENDGKYKCTRCHLPFCSVACSKIHRDNHPPDPEPPLKTDGATGPSISISDQQPVPTATASPFSILDDSEQLRYLFKRYPRLPQQLLAIGSAADPPTEAQPTNIKEAILAKAAAMSKPKKEQWNHDVGVRKGKEALRRARKASGDDGEGIREYSELITHLISNALGNDADLRVRDQTAQQDSELIRRLLEEEQRR